MKAFQAAQAGIQLVPEDRRIIGGLTVEENLVLAQVSGQKGWTIEKIYDTSRALPNAAARKPSPCPAANNRCWPSPARSRAI